MALIDEQPGITVGEAAERLKTSRNTLYNVTGRLQREGRLRKDGRGFYPAEQPAGPEPQAARPTVRPARFEGRAPTGRRASLRTPRRP